MTESELMEVLSGLLDKYQTLAVLRERREEAEAAGLTSFGAPEASERTAAFRRIAREYPGALRELETSPSRLLRLKAGMIRREIEELRRHPGRRATAPAWMAIVDDYHRVLREALAVKLWLAGRLPRGSALNHEVIAEFRQWHQHLPRRSRLEDGDYPAFIERHRRPRAGRLHSLVWDDLERLHGLSKSEIEQVVFGIPPRALGFDEGGAGLEGGVEEKDSDTVP